MAMCDTPTLARWTKRFKDNPTDFGGFGISNAITLMTSFPIHESFMLHMQSRWNPETRSYHIGGKQMCPTVEEFRAIMMIPDAPILRLAPYDNTPSLSIALHSLIAISKMASKVLFKDNKMDLMRWSDIVLEGGPIPETVWSIPTTLTIMLAHYFLAPGDARPLTKVFEVATSLMRQRYDISGLVLAETLLGLNESSRTTTSSKRGAPHILYIWLLEKVRFLPPLSPETNISLSVQLDRLRNVRPEATIPNTIRPRDTLPWYRISTVMYSMESRPMVTLFGMESSCAYITTHLHDQFGRRETPATEHPATLFDKPITHRMFVSYLDMWNDAKRLEVMSSHEDNMEAYLSGPSRKRTLLPIQGPPAKKPRDVNIPKKTRARAQPSARQRNRE